VQADPRQVRGGEQCDLGLDGNSDDPGAESRTDCTRGSACDSDAPTLGAWVPVAPEEPAPEEPVHGRCHPFMTGHP
jgi:hypothetical protein